jgi:hypothetical protein
MKIPINLIKYNYTSGNEFVNPNTNVPYQGYYYETNGVFFAGREFNVNAPKIIKKENENKYLNDPKIATYAKLTGFTSQNSSEPNITSLPQLNPEDARPNYNPEGTRSIEYYNISRFFAQKINSNPTVIKEIDEKTYNSLQNSPFYITTYINLNQPLAQANDQMPGLRTFLGG